MELQYLKNKLRKEYISSFFWRLVVFFLLMSFIILISINMEGDLFDSPVFLIIFVLLLYGLVFKWIGSALVGIFKPLDDIYHNYSDINVLAKIVYEMDHNKVKQVGPYNIISKRFLRFGKYYSHIVPLSSIILMNKSNADPTKDYCIYFNDIYGRYHCVTFDIRKDLFDDFYNTLIRMCPNAIHDCSDKEFKDRLEHYTIEHEGDFTEEDMFKDFTLVYRKATKKKEEVEEVKDDNKEEVVEEKKPVKKVATKKVEKKVVPKKKVVMKDKDINTKYEELTKLKELLDNDIITKEEVDNEKSKILND